ncbi:MAG: serine hydrolase domain-containing protein [Mobilitalea sp.]
MIGLETQYAPKDVEYEEERVAKLNHFFEDLVEKKKIQSANYCLARYGKVFANNAVGKLSFREEDARELTPDTIQRIASITKLFASVAIWQLVEDGKLRVTQKVGEIIEEFSEKPFDEITIAHLLSHTSGMHPDGGCFPNKYYVSQWDFIQEDKGKNWIAAALKTGMRKKPGEEWAYCSFGFVVLGEIITRISGEFANDYIVEHIIKPCGLNDTGFDFERKDIVSRTNIPHERREKFIKEIMEGTHKEEEENNFWEKIPSTGGGLYSTAYDLCRFGIMLQQGGALDGTRVIGRKAIEKMSTLYTTPDIKDYCWNAGGPYRQYGLGPDMRCNDASIYTQGTFFHEGAGGCCLIIDPTEKMVAAWFVPFINDVWTAEPMYNAAAVMWSGIK